MGFETALAIGAGANVLGGLLNYGEQRAARKRQQSATDAGVALTQGSNPVDALIMQRLSQPNAGQDGFLQYLRANPNGLQPYMFNYSQAFKDYGAQDAQNLQTQLGQLRSSVGSLGERFGTGFAQKEANLRSQFLAGVSARNAGIAQNSFNTALQYGTQGYALGQQQNNQLLGLLLNSQQGRTAQQLQALGLAAQPLPGTGNTVTQGGVDLAQLLLLGNYFKGSGAGGGGGTGGSALWNPGPSQWNPSPYMMSYSQPYYG